MPALYKKTHQLQFVFVKEINAYGAVILQYPVIVRVLLFSKNTHKSQAKQIC